MDDSDHRRSARVNLSSEIILEYGGRCLRVPTMDLSAQGVSVWVPWSATRGPVRVTMAINDHAVILRGRVARQFESDDGALWGIEFGPDADEESRRTVVDYVEAHAH